MANEQSVGSDLALSTLSLYPQGAITLRTRDKTFLWESTQPSISTFRIMRLVLVILLGLLPLIRGDVSERHIDAAGPNSSEISNLTFPAHVARHRYEDSVVPRQERRWNGPPPAPATDDVWEKMKCKGRKFMAQMSYSDFDVGQMLPVPQNTAQSPWYLGGS